MKMQNMQQSASGSARFRGNTARREDGVEHRSLPDDKTILVDHDSKDVPASFHFTLWFVFTIENWLLDFCRPILALLFTEWFPRSLPSVGDYCHMLYNLITAFIMLQLLSKCVSPVPKYIQQLLVIVFVMGASIHLVGDSVQHRLIEIGYKNHLTVRDNPIMQSLQPPSLIDSFELLYFYDEHLGHEMWYIPLFSCYVILFISEFQTSSKTMTSSTIPVSGWLLLLPSAMFEWYMVTEGQMAHIFITMLSAMTATLVYYGVKGYSLGVNGRWLLYRSVLVVLLVGVWVGFLWNDQQLRKRYPELLYVPEPWSYYTLYLRDSN